jgi:hypothetical protein
MPANKAGKKTQRVAHPKVRWGYIAIYMPQGSGGTWAEAWKKPVTTPSWTKETGGRGNKKQMCGLTQEKCCTPRYTNLQIRPDRQRTASRYWIKVGTGPHLWAQELGWGSLQVWTTDVVSVSLMLSLCPWCCLCVPCATCVSEKNTQSSRHSSCHNYANKLKAQLNTSL